MDLSEFSPIGSSKKKHFSAAELRKIHERAKQADLIHKQAEAHHQAHDVPAAERMLEEELGKL